MDDTNFKLFAIVADDESIARKMMVHALQAKGFACHSASDGEEVMQLIATSDYDLVVTDLAMPHKNGHALAVELLQLAKRPVIVIHTAVTEPKITKDLMLRGVDDIVYKPTDCAAFAAKMRILVERRKSELERAARRSKSLSSDGTTFEPGTRPDSAKECVEGTADSESVIGVSENRPQDAAIVRVNTPTKETLESWGIESLPFSLSALDVCRLACDDDSEAKDIATAIGREPALTAEILRVGNSSYYNRSGKPMLDLEEIIVRIGRRHVGELAIALDACSTIRNQAASSFDMGLVWRRSLAARAALELLVSQSSSRQVAPGLMLSAVMHLLGRIVLVKQFPDDMTALVDTARKSGEAISTLEKKTFSSYQSELLADLLSRWEIPGDIIGPLRHLELSYDELVKLDPPHRRSAELVKLSVFVGWLAVGQWDPWDMVEIPPNGIFENVSSQSLALVIEKTRANVDSTLVNLGEEKLLKLNQNQMTSVRYKCLDKKSCDFVVELLPSLGIRASGAFNDIQPVNVVNCINSSKPQIEQAAQECSSSRCAFIASGHPLASLSHSFPTATTPCAFGELESFFGNL